MSHRTANILREMYPKEEHWDRINSGRKDLEVRVGYEGTKKIAQGEKIIFYRGRDVGARWCAVEVCGIRIYPSFEEMLKHEDPKRINPDDPSGVLEEARKIYSPMEESLGVYVLEIKKPE